MHGSALAFLAGPDGRRSISRLCQPLELPNIQLDSLGPFDINGETYSLPRFTFAAENSDDAVRLGIFAAIHGDEPASALAVVQFLRELSALPEWAAGYHVRAYPVCNPTGFEDDTRHSRAGRDLNREFWKHSAEPEVRILEKELETGRFDGLIQLHADDTSDGIYGFVRGHTLTENLLRPALAEAEKILPRNVYATIDGFAAQDSVIYSHYDGVLAAPKQIEPVPFEIILETPHFAPIDAQVRAFTVALKTIMIEYRRLMAFAQNI